MSLISSEKATEIILSNTLNFGVQHIDFLKSLGRVLKEDIVADRDFPPFNRISMDGIAIKSETFKKGIKEFQIEGVQAAGSEQLILKNDKNCIEAMTGGILPKYTDAVIPYELIEIENNIAKILIDDVNEFQNVHKKGLDRNKGDVIISKNTIISSAEIGVLATVGKSTVTVAKQPKVLIISTGNELVEVNQVPADYQIRRSNVFTLVSLLERINIQAHTTHIPDEEKLLEEKIKTFLEEYDVLLFSGAVSKGKFDFIPSVLDKLGVEKLFHRVKQRPGKPFWFGRKANTVIFAFPGNPVSTFANCIKFFYPWYYKSVNVSPKIQVASLSEDYFFKPELTYYLQVKIDFSNGELIASPITGRGSGDLANLIDADGFLELPSNRTNFTKGEKFPFYSYR